jgi:UDP-GlcNAc:undecaprenyl-phosphate GlcNAc-1-phosphate transferase
MMQYLAIAFISAFLALLLLLRTRLVSIALDQPNQRSLHSMTTPRTGGLAIMVGVLIAWCLMMQAWLWIALLLFLVIVSLVDDVRGLSVRWRLLAQLLTCTIFVLVNLPNLAWWAQVLLVLAATWMVNLYNFMDGSDGLAGGMALYGFGSYALAAYFANDVQLALMSGAIASAALAFLLFNFHPARIFMGDAGSVPLGFLAGSIGLYGWQHGNWPLWFPILVFSPFIVDATVTLLKRLLRGEKIWQAHRSHYYQRLVQLGWGHRKTAIVEYALMLAVGVSAVFLLTQPGLVVLYVLTLWVLLYVAIMWLIDRFWAAHIRI